ncbi:DUF805 domain-containing protein [Winogradskyella sp. 3972H.M.0a.05]|uniref:DUF805 domain-containing protein n=1 Tax=Winogradskyella sp. 3972H.M.0a.05 TaxID=2950277 RepID=UPI003393FC10
MNWYLKVLRQYADFNGRARRKEYWMFVLFNMMFAFAAVLLDNLFGIAIEGVGYGPLYGLYALAVLIPGLAVGVRRLHDTGKSGWMILIAFIPLIGGIWLLVLMATEGDSGSNAYGPDPKDPDAVGYIESGSNTGESSSTGDMLILIAVIWMFLSRTFWVFVPRFVDDFYSTTTFKILNGFMGLIWAVIPLALAFAVKDKSKRTVLFVLAGIYLLYGLYETVERFFFM